MSYIVDAWLERGEPQLRVTSEQTGQVVIDWKAERVREAIETGAINVSELQSATRDLTDTVKELVLQSGSC